MIKKYSQFLNEKLDNKFLSNWDKIDNLSDGEVSLTISYFKRHRSDLAKKIKSLSSYYESYFSNLASGDSDPEEDFSDMQKILDVTGYTLDIIKKLFDSKVSKLISQDFKMFIDEFHLNDVNGYVDTYLYYLNDKLNLNYSCSLGGEGWVSALNDSPEEWIIKYSYGYHNTLYGQLLLKTINLTPEKFIEMVGSKIAEYIKNQLIENISYYINHNKLGSNYAQFLPSVIDKYVINDDDGCFVYYESIVDELNNFLNSDIGTKTLVDFVLQTSNFYNLQLKDTGEYLYIHINNISSN